MTFTIRPHGRLQEWVADEEGYFAEEGLDYAFAIPDRAPPQRDERGQVKQGAYQSYEAGREASISCACHWTVDEAAANRFGRLVTNVYSVTPGGLMVPPDSDVRVPEDLSGVPVAVGYQSGSHYSTLQALEAFLDREQIELSFEGAPPVRLDSLVEGRIPAATLFGVQLYIAEALGFRKVADTTFMIAFLAHNENAQPEDLDKYFAGMRRAQMAIDLRPEKYKRHHAQAVPDHYRDRVDVRTFGPGERMVFLPYTGETYDQTQAWIHEREIFDGVDEAPTFDQVVKV